MTRHFELVGDFFPSTGRYRTEQQYLRERRRDETQFEHYADDWDEEVDGWRYAQCRD